MTYLAVGCRVLLCVVFSVAVASKLRGPGAFADFVGSVRRMRILPPVLAGPTAAAVVVTELAIVLALAVPAWESGVLGLGSAAVLLVLMATAVTVTLARGNREPCRCFGRSETPLGAGHVVRAVALVIVALLGLPGSLSGTPADPGIAVVVAVGGALVGALVVMFDDLVSLVRTGGPAPIR